MNSSINHTARSRSLLQKEADVILALVIRELKTRFGHMRLGLLWALVEPLVHVLIFSALWGLRGHLDILGVHAYFFVLSGSLPWSLFQNISSRLMTAVAANRGLFHFHQVRPLHTFIARTLLEVAIFILLYLVLIGTGLYIGLDFKVADPVQFCLAYLVLIMLACMTGGLLAILVAAMPEVEKFTGWVFRVLFFMSGVYFPSVTLPFEWQSVLALNPILCLIELGREGLFGQRISSFVEFEWILVLIAALSLLFVALYKTNWRRMMAS